MDIQDLQNEIEHLKQEILNFKYNSTHINKHTKVLFDKNKYDDLIKCKYWLNTAMDLIKFIHNNRLLSITKKKMDDEDIYILNNILSIFETPPEVLKITISKLQQFYL